MRERKDESFALKEAPGMNRSDPPRRDILASVKVIPHAAPR